MIRAIATAIVRRRFWLVVVIGLLTVFFASQLRHLNIVIDPSAMLPKLHPNVIGTTAAETLFGSKYVVVVGVGAADGGSAYRPEVLRVVADLTRDLAKVPGVKAHTLLSVTSDRARAISGTSADMTVEPLLRNPADKADVANLAGALKQNPIYQNTLMSADSTLATVSFSVEIGPKGFRQVMDKVQVVLDQAKTPQVTVISSGTAVFFANVERFSARMAYLFPIALILIGLVHFEAFRTRQGMILPLVTALLAVIWSLGLMGSARVSMDAFNATTPILILAVAAGHAVQILKRYYEEYARLSALHPRDPLSALNDRAVVESLVKVAPVMLTAGLVAALGFFSLMTFEIATIRTFGIFTGLGILSALLIELTFIPALRSYLPAPKFQPQVQAHAADTTGCRETRVWDRLAGRLTALITQRSKPVISCFAVLACVAVLAASNVSRENSTKSYFGEGLQLRQEDRVLNQKLAGTNTLYVVFQGSHADHMKDPAVLRTIEDAQAYIATLPDVGKTISMVDLLKQMNKSMNAGNNAFYAIPASQDLVSQFLLLYSMSGQPTDFDAYVDYQYQNANLLVWMKNDSSKYAETMVATIRAYVEPRLPKGVTMQIGGSVPQTSALSESLVKGKIQNIAQMMGFVFVAGVLVFRSLLAGVYLVLPLMFTVLVNFGVMGLTGIPLNTPNSVSSAMAIGIGADYAIYLLYRIREELGKTQDVDTALFETMKTAGKAVFFVASAISVGYAVLMLSFNFYVHIWFGMLIVLSMIVSAVSALILIPALIKWHTPRFLSRQGMAGSGGSVALVVGPRLRPSAQSSATAGVAALASATAVIPTGPATSPAPSTVLSSTLVACLVLVGLASSVGDANSQTTQDLQVDALMEKNYQSTRVDSSTSQASFRLVNASGQERSRVTFGATKLLGDGIANRRVIRFLAPGDVRNTTTLLLENPGKDDEIWVYLPAMKKARRLASNNKKNSFVGTDLSFGDLVGHRAKDWSHKLLKQESLAGTAVYVVESLPKTPEIAADSGYSKRVSWVAKESGVSVKVEFYDMAGTLLKTLENSNVMLVDPKQNKYQPMQVQVKNHQTGHATFLKFEQFVANQPVSETYFAAGYLEKEE
jgi:uncharacterized protein